MSFKQILGMIWACIPTCVALIYVMLCTSLGWYRFIGKRDICWVWSPRLSNCPGFVRNYWMKWGGHTIGNIIVVKDPFDLDTITHEKKHVMQYMTFGIFFFVVYFLGSLMAKLAGENHYFGNPFEVAARRHAKQKIDRI